MACSSCGHTMANLGVEGQRIFWCARCGCTKSVTGADEFESVSIPLFVTRVKALLAETVPMRVGNGPVFYSVPAAFMVAIAESVGVKS